MFSRMYKTGYNWCLKYWKGAILVFLVYLFLEIGREVINKYFGINVSDIFILKSFSLYGTIIFCLGLFIEAWVVLEFLNYIYKGEAEEKHEFAIFDKVKLYIIPAFIGSFILSFIMVLPTVCMSMSGEMFSVSEGSGKILWLILLLVFLLFVFPLSLWFALRLSFLRKPTGLTSGLFMLK